MHILFIEPDVTLGKMYCQHFKSSGHSVDWERSGQAAIHAIDQKRPDIIVLEPVLGLHNGIEFLYELRSYSEWQDIPLVAHTMNQLLLDNVYQEPLAQLGIKALLYKPQATARQLLQTIDRFERPRPL